MRIIKNSARQWLLDNRYGDIAAMIEEIVEEWDRQGNGTRRSWWEVLAGHKNGSPCVVQGRVFPVLRSARLRQGLPITKGCVCRNKAEVFPPLIQQARWSSNSGK